MDRARDGFPILSFASGSQLRAWLQANGATSDGIWLRIFKRGSGVESVTFDEVLDAGLCFGWSESKRLAEDNHSYLQRFTPRRAKGTKSERNRRRVERLIEEGLMTSQGLRALGMGDSLALDREGGD
jgi:uncharacterized protein YdeI (YjbR/CyaY-like superfamily)